MRFECEIFVAETTFCGLLPFGKHGWETMFPCLSIFGKHDWETMFPGLCIFGKLTWLAITVFLVDLSSGNMAETNDVYWFA